MQITLNNINENNYKNNSKLTSFKGPLDGAITQTLMTIDTNQMVNSTLVDLVSMVIPRTYIDTKERNKFAGFETFFREITGTVIMCLSSGVVAMGIAGLYNKIKNPEINIKPNTWATNGTIDLLKHSWDNSEKNVEKYVGKVISGSAGADGRKTATWQNIEWDKVNWIDNPKWNNIKWQNPKLAEIVNTSKNEKNIIKILSGLITDKNISHKDAKNALEIIEARIANALKVGNSIDVTIDEKTTSATLKNILRDTYDLGKNIFANDKIDLNAAIKKLKSMSKVKTLGSIAVVATIGLVNQYINRQITKRRTGKDDFVGQDGFEKNNKSINNSKAKEKKNNKLELGALKALAGAGIFALSMKVMKIKNPADFIKKLEFTGPITSGNAIKTLYTATLIGRFLAARDKDELRESATRDYLGFLNWLVLGGFVSKGVLQLFDPKQELLFNIKEDGSKGAKRWLNNINEKTHAEIAAQGLDFAKKHIWQKNIAQVSGLLYSGLALGFALPLLNIIITKNKNKKDLNSIKNDNTPDLNMPHVFGRFS